MPARILAGAMCVQRFDDSLNSAIHITYRISLRSSSMPEPRDPLLKVLIHLFFALRPLRECCKNKEFDTPGDARAPPKQQVVSSHRVWELNKLDNDPSAGSPTETLLRLLLPLNDRVWKAFRPWVVVAHLPGPVRMPH